MTPAIAYLLVIFVILQGAAFGYLFHWMASIMILSVGLAFLIIAEAKR